MIISSNRYRVFVTIRAAHKDDNPFCSKWDMDAVKTHLHYIKLEAAKGTPIDARLIKRLEREIAKLENDHSKTQLYDSEPTR